MHAEQFLLIKLDDIFPDKKHFWHLMLLSILNFSAYDNKSNVAEITFGITSFNLCRVHYPNSLFQHTINFFRDKTFE
jgi:hypothetical protein